MTKSTRFSEPSEALSGPQKVLDFATKNHIGLKTPRKFPENDIR